MIEAYRTQTIDQATKHSDLIALDFGAAYSRANEWRGHMIENYSRAEHAVTETLVGLNDLSVDLKGQKFPHLVGQRVDRLAAYLSTITASAHSKAAEEALLNFRAHENLRAMLCHGVTKLALDRGGGWVAVMTLLSFKSGGSVSSRLTIDEAEGVQRRNTLIADRKRLTATLGQVRREIANSSQSVAKK